MTVRRRLLGFAVGFLVAAAFVTSAHAQQGGSLTPQQVKDRIAEVFSGIRVGNGMPTLPLSANPTPEQMQKLIEFAKKLGVEPGRDNKFSADQLKQLQQKAQAAVQNGGLKQQDGPPPFDPSKKNRTDTKTTDPADPAPNLNDNPRVKPRDPPPPVPPLPDKKTDIPQPPNLPPQQDKPFSFPGEQPVSPQDKARQAAAAVWEQNIGPLSETPSVQKALFDIIDGTGELKDPDGNNLFESLSKELGNGKGFGDLFNGIESDDWNLGGGDWNLGGGDWSLPKLNWNFNWGSNRTPDAGSLGPPRESWFSKWRRSPSSGSSSGSSWFSGWKAPHWNVGVPSLDGTWWPLLFVIAALVGGVFLWKWLARRGRPDSNSIDPYALGPWPVDPHHLTTRQDVVVAFEHLSVLLCGPVAKTWTHTTIAGALSEMAMAEPRRAMMLARLYELARYTPRDEPLTTAELAEARRLVCKLAGFTDD